MEIIKMCPDLLHHALMPFSCHLLHWLAHPHCTQKLNYMESPFNMVSIPMVLRPTEADLILCVEASPQCQKKSYKELIIRVKTATTKQQMLRTKTCCKSRFDVVVDLLTCEHWLSNEESPAIIFIGKSTHEGIRPSQACDLEWTPHTN